MISATELQKQYKTETGQIVHALHNVSFEVNSGDFFVLLGPSGSGKTTTLRSVAGIETADGGDIKIGSNTVFNSAQGVNVPAEERPIAMVFQSYALWPHMDVYNNIVFPLRKGVRRVSAEEIKRRVETVSETLELTPYLRRPISKLSGGQQQRVALARALALEPDVLLMDEPLSNLDAKLRTQLRVEIKNLTRSLGITTLYVTHDQVEAMVMGDQIAVMNNGSIAEQGTPEQLYKRPKSKFVAKFLGEMNFVTGTLDHYGGEITALTPFGRHTIDKLSSQKSGSTVTLGFRPEDVRVGNASDSSVVRARVTQAHYIGDALLCDMEVSGCQFTARLPNTIALSAGDQTQVSLPSSAFVAFD